MKMFTAIFNGLVLTQGKRASAGAVELAWDSSDLRHTAMQWGPSRASNALHRGLSATHSTTYLLSACFTLLCAGQTSAAGRPSDTYAAAE